MHRPEREKHQPDEKERRERQDGVDHFPFGDQVHEEAGDQKRFGAGDGQRDGDIDFAAGKRDE